MDDLKKLDKKNHRVCQLQVGRSPKAYPLQTRILILVASVHLTFLDLSSVSQIVQNIEILHRPEVEVVVNHIPGSGRAK